MKKYLIVIFIFLIGCSATPKKQKGIDPIKHNAKTTIIAQNISIYHIAKIETQIGYVLEEIYRTETGFYKVEIDVERLKVEK